MSEKKKLLALDGGGIRGVLSLGILEAIEQTVGKKLGDYFDYIGGTSTGAIIAAALASGMTVAELREFYKKNGAEMFEPRFLLRRHKSLYGSEALKQKLQEVFGEKTTLGSARRPLLLVVTRNWSTDSPWPLSSNPDAIFNSPERPDCNLNIPLWQLVRASTAAPVYFLPEVMQFDPSNQEKTFVFQDGGVTPYNNPGFLMYRMATLPPYKLGWKAGEDKMLIISVGTGAAPQLGPMFDNPERTIPVQLLDTISAVMYSASVDQDINCRTVGRCVYGAPIDREMGDLIPAAPLTEDQGKQFLYARYNVEFTETELRKLEVREFDLNELQKMDLATDENIQKLIEIGNAAGKAQVRAEHFGSFLTA